MTQKPYLCADCGERTDNRNLLCDACTDEPARCGECIVCKSDMAEIMACVGNGEGDHV